MFETKIKFQGKERTIKFGAWVNGNIEKIVNKKTMEIWNCSQALSSLV